MDGFIPRCPTLRASVTAALICFGSSSLITSAEPRVGGLDELVIYDPGKHERGLPAIEFAESPKGTQIEIQPTTHVHRFYYNGDKEYQGPLMSGGPTLVVASHPRTGKRLYIDVNLPSGAPVIAYCEDKIIYVFQDRRVVLSFSRTCDKRVHVTYLSGRGRHRQHRDNAKASAERHRQSELKNGLSHALQEAGASAKKTVVGTFGVAGKAVGSVVDGAKSTLENLPLIKQAQSAADQRIEQGQIEANTQTQKLNDLKTPEFLKTNR
jgi:hypothetical protein